MATNEKEKKAPVKPSESVNSLIQKNQAEKESAVAASAESKIAGVQEGVAEVIGGMEKPSEKISERQGESGQKGDLPAQTNGTTKSDNESAKVEFTIKDYTFPSEEIMVKKIRTAIATQIKEEWKKATQSQKNLAKGSSASYNESIAKIRELKTMMNSLLTNTVTFMKELYVKYFTPDGKRKS